MNDTPTPETDAAIRLSNGQWSYVLRDHARKLERERDAWERIAHDKLGELCVEIAAKQKAARERDAQIALNESLTAANIKLLERLEQAQAEAEAMRDQIVPHHTTHIFPWE